MIIKNEHPRGRAGQKLVFFIKTIKQIVNSFKNKTQNSAGKPLVTLKAVNGISAAAIKLDNVFVLIENDK